MPYIELPPIEHARLKATYRGYYAKDLGRLCCVFFGSWVGASWESADDAHKKLAPMPRQRYVLGAIDVGTIDVLS